MRGALDETLAHEDDFYILLRALSRRHDVRPLAPVTVLTWLELKQTARAGQRGFRTGEGARDWRNGGLLVLSRQGKRQRLPAVSRCGRQRSSLLPGSCGSDDRVACDLSVTISGRNRDWAVCISLTQPNLAKILHLNCPRARAYASPMPATIRRRR